METFKKHQNFMKKLFIVSIFILTFNLSFSQGRLPRADKEKIAEPYSNYGQSEQFVLDSILIDYIQKQLNIVSASMERDSSELRKGLLHFIGDTTKKMTTEYFGHEIIFKTGEKMKVDSLEKNDKYFKSRDFWRTIEFQNYIIQNRAVPYHEIEKTKFKFHVLLECESVYGLNYFVIYENDRFEIFDFKMGPIKSEDRAPKKKKRKKQ
jgi:hypothetical protein